MTHTQARPIRHTWGTLAWIPALGLLLALGALSTGAPVPAKLADRRYTDQIKPFLAQNCLKCHSGEKPKGGFHLDRLGPDFNDKPSREQWQKLLKQVQSGTMPPKARPRPDPKGIQVLADWIHGSVVAAETARRASQGRVVLRRLNRIEYENTVSDLLGVEVNVRDQLPQDGAANGFDNVGTALHTSSFLLEKYLEAADTALNLAIANLPRPRLIKKRYFLKDQHQVKATTERVYRHLGDTTVCFCSSAWQSVGITHFYPPDRGHYRFRISASGYQSSGKPITYRVTAGRTRLTGKSGLVGYFDAPADKPTVVEFVRYLEPKTTISILPYGLAGSQTVHKIGAANYTGPGLAVQWVDVEGPLYDSWPPASHRRIFGDLPQGPSPIYNHRDRVEVVSKDPLVDAERILRAFAGRAFRRDVTDRDIKPFLGLVKARLDEKESFEKAVRVGLLGIMVSPDFLFLREKPGKLDDFALASRLSYFLWSTMPDDALLAVARQGKLSQREELHRQVERMLADPRASTFTENFVGQWLNLREIDATEPSHILYPDYDHMLKVSMIRETELFFTELLKDNLPLTNFVASDFTMLNGRLAKHYGIPGVDGWEFHKVKLPPDTHRGGVLTMASVMKVTANGTNTSPVLRGAWVLDRILGTPPPPPPEGVSALEPDIRGATTIRQQLAKHRSVPSCASCHQQIDPPGFALESFDVIGGWRENYRTTGRGKPVTVNGRRMSYHEGLKVDPADVLPDGRRFANIDEFKQLLLKDPEQIARALTVKLLTYATGGAPETADKPEIEAIVRKVREQKYGFRTLIHEIVQSKLFQNK
jgi:mono/diheme cytochrome c family protein